MGMFWCKDCKAETPGVKCRFCGGENTYKYWWTFPDPTGRAKGIKISYNEDGSEKSRIPY